ncbi:MAG TPA: hypothetical protein VF468_02315 [Actinomycetota bacterium]|nr:hypothetical protein [Actinomycetota bacterium]
MKIQMLVASVPRMATPQATSSTAMRCWEPAGTGGRGRAPAARTPSTLVIGAPPAGMPAGTPIVAAG